jgi:hypothetical protein
MGSLMWLGEGCFMGKFEGVRAFLETQVRGRPQTLKEIQAAVSKSAPRVWKELQGLVKLGEVNVVVLLFNNHATSFYTMQDRVTMSVVSGTSSEIIRLVEIKELRRK